MSVVTLLTDFGTADGYAGILHGVILRINPYAVVVDLSHDIAAQDIHAAAFVLANAYPYFSSDTIHVVVVDPGVGSVRRAMAVRTPSGTFVAPDNGVLSYILAHETTLEMVQLTQARYWLTPLGTTFHGRDLFAPVAAHLSLGISLHELGEPLQDPMQFNLPQAQRLEDGSLQGEVLHVDRFGNLVTNVPGAWLAPDQSWNVDVARHTIRGIQAAYALAAPGELLAVIGSSGCVEIAVRDGNASVALQVGRSAAVRLMPEAR